MSGIGIGIGDGLNGRGLNQKAFPTGAGQQTCFGNSQPTTEMDSPMDCWSRSQQD